MEKKKELKDRELTEENLNEISGGAVIGEGAWVNHPCYTVKDPNDPELTRLLSDKRTLLRLTDEELKFLKKRGYNHLSCYHGEPGIFAIEGDAKDAIWCLITNGFKVSLTGIDLYKNFIAKHKK